MSFFIASMVVLDQHNRDYPKLVNRIGDLVEEVLDGERKFVQPLVLKQGDDASKLVIRLSDPTAFRSEIQRLAKWYKRESAEMIRNLVELSEPSNRLAVIGHVSPNDSEIRQFLEFVGEEDRPALKVLEALCVQYRFGFSVANPFCIPEMMTSRINDVLAGLDKDGGTSLIRELGADSPDQVVLVQLFYDDRIC